MFPTQGTAPNVVSAVRLSVSASRITGATPVMRATFTPREVFSTMRARPKRTTLFPEHPLKGLVVIGNAQIMRAGFVALVSLLTHLAIPTSATAAAEFVKPHSLRIAGRAIPLCPSGTHVIFVMQGIATFAIPISETSAGRVRSLKSSAFPTVP